MNQGQLVASTSSASLSVLLADDTVDEQFRSENTFNTTTSAPAIPVVGSSNSQRLSEGREPTARPLRSKKQRPCDRCRQRKSRCAIETFGKPCTECLQTGNACTFLLPPPVRPKKEAVPSILDAPPPPIPLISPRLVVAPSPSPTAAVTGGDTFTQERPSKRPRLEGSGDSSLDQDLPSDVEYSVLTATLTDDLLTTHDGVGPPRKLVSSRGHSTFITFSRKPSYRSTSHDLEESTLSQIRSFVDFATRGRDTRELVDRYYSRFLTAYPVLSTTTPFDDLPPGLRAFVLVESIATSPEFRLAGLEARRMLKAVHLANRMLESTAKLSSISAALLELNMNLDPRGDFLLLSKTIAHAQLLGLHIDCQGSSIPDAEKELRTRLWWTLRIHDAWSSFLNSRPSHLQHGNTSVLLPRFATDTSHLDDIAFGCACRLGTVVARLQQEVSILDRYGSSQRIESCDSIETDLNTMKEGLKEYYEMTEERPPGLDAVLFLILALRCMVRRISIEIRIGIGSSFNPDQSTLSIFSELVLFIEHLASTAPHLAYDWLGYSSHVFSSVLSSLVRLSLAYTANAPDPSRSSSSSPVTLLATLVRSLTQISPHFDLVNSALERASNVITRLTAASSSDFDAVISALRGLEPVNLETGFLDTLASLATEPSLNLGENLGSSTANVETIGDLESWMTVAPFWEELGGIDWNLLTSSDQSL
ncbi:Zn(II)2Cys6 transcription factor [Sporobolomyces salmoneus]|uniref:Zn(II)2Cys6 transcription factor n=1 Tax=Sporobolomyces salmoneus TaxID=183962 RepID=UPI00317331A0